MDLLTFLHVQFDFLNSELFTFFYSLVVYMNPFALLPQLYSSFRSEPKKLLGVSVLMFVVFLIIQITISLGAIKILNGSLALSMASSAVVTVFIIIVTMIRRCGYK